MPRKRIRIIRYRGVNKMETWEEQAPAAGYAVGFQDLLRTVLAMSPSHEEIVDGVRTRIPIVPEIALREVIANALIHQDLTVGGAGPLIEIFSDRIEVSNPVDLLTEPDRLIDAPPRSRNEALASLMMRLRIAEERGSGVDKVVGSIEARALPAPTFRVAGGATIVTLFGERPFARMSSDDRVRACYQHACLRYASADPMSNATLRERLGLRDEQYPQASIVIRSALDAGRIKPADTNQGRRNARYVPYWA